LSFWNISICVIGKTIFSQPCRHSPNGKVGPGRGHLSFLDLPLPQLLGECTVRYSRPQICLPRQGTHPENISADVVGQCRQFTDRPDSDGCHSSFASIFRRVVRGIVVLIYGLLASGPSNIAVRLDLESTRWNSCFWPRLDRSLVTESSQSELSSSSVISLSDTLPSWPRYFYHVFV
jgi:hypothetical protein